MTRFPEDFIHLIQELIEFQQKKIYDFGAQYIPHLTSDDLLQPNDFPELENNPLFRYEEGILEGMMTVRSALLAHLKES